MRHTSSSLLGNADDDVAQDNLLLQIWTVAGHPACDADHQNMFDVGKRAAHIGKGRGGWFDTHARAHNALLTILYRD
ncbi:hypothetical protein QBC32DRAFT_328319 [Pseudoneurospora amorphoporcata]|uniref:Uncharacterized protein n=1 Tax=Pseudoneurospora amorphoporcata TaxID=241081 RepID=A0AAN6SBQ2_9PEZI|nr:hypothetical protein QBC32DRAFT_328319 [Pseudoneurospora amorphoporcata]